MEWDREMAYMRAKGRAQGREEGVRQKAVETARNALAMNLTAEQTAQITGLTLEQVLDLQKGMAAQPAN